MAQNTQSSTAWGASPAVRGRGFSREASGAGGSSAVFSRGMNRLRNRPPLPRLFRYTMPRVKNTTAPTKFTSRSFMVSWRPMSR